MIIQPVKALTVQHWQLLLLADPERQAIKRYLSTSMLFEAHSQQTLAGLIALKRQIPRTLKIVNLAVVPQWQNQHIATRLLRYAQQYGYHHHYRTLTVGTGTTSFGPLYLYQKIGFRVVGVKRDFFVCYYQQPIYEHHLHLRDMLQLAMPLCH